MLSERLRRPAAFLALLTTAAFARAADQRSALERGLPAKYRLSSINAEGEFVNTGSTLVLKQSGLVGGSQYTCVNQYKDGRITLVKASKGTCAGAVRIFSKIPGVNLIPGVGGVANTAQGVAPATRPFVAGEKVWVTKIEVKDAVIFTLISEKISDVRYKADLRFDKVGSLDLSPAEQTIAEVLGVGGGVAPRPAVQSAAAPAVAGPDTSAPAVEAPAAAPLAPIAAPPPPADSAALPSITPPPPPADQPAPALSAGLTVDQVVAMLGQPQQIADLGAKKIYTYPSAKVTFVEGKVAEVRNPADNSVVVADTSVTEKSSVNLLPYEVGVGVIAVAVAAFLLGRRRNPAVPAAYAPAAYDPAAYTHVPQGGYPMGMPVSPPPLPQMPPPPQAFQPPVYQPAPPPAFQAPPPASPPVNPIERLSQLETLLGLGIITREEFEAEREKLRGSS